jgi:hypothetical protein
MGDGQAKRGISLPKVPESAIVHTTRESLRIRISLRYGEPSNSPGGSDLHVQNGQQG